MSANTYNLHRRARMVMFELDPEQQARVRERLQSLVGLPPSQWPGATDFSTPDSAPDYLVPVDDSLRLIVRAEAGKPLEVLDIVFQDRLDAFAKLAAKTAE